MTSTIMTLYFSDNLLRASGKEPCPLDGTEEWQPLLSSLAFSDPDQFGEDETLQGEDQGAKVPGNGNGNDTERRGEKNVDTLQNMHTVHTHTYVIYVYIYIFKYLCEACTGKRATVLCHETKRKVYVSVHLHDDLLILSMLLLCFSVLLMLLHDACCFPLLPRTGGLVGPVCEDGPDILRPAAFEPASGPAGIKL